MWHWLNRLFGGVVDPATTEDWQPTGQRSKVIDRYFQLSGQITEAKSDGNYGKAVEACRATYPLLADFVREWKREYGSFDIDTSHAVHTGATLMAIVGDREGLQKIRKTLRDIPDLHDWLPGVDEAERDAALVDAILTAVEEEPGILQNQLKKRIATGDARRLSTLAHWLEKGGRIRRVRTGNTYRLHLPGAPSEREPATLTPKGETLPPVPLFPRHKRRARKPRTIDLERLPYVRLPKAPRAWHERGGRKRGKGTKKRGEPKPPLFEVDGDGWALASEERLPVEDRPDPYYKESLPTSGFTYLIDPKGHREGFEEAAAVLRVTGREGSQVAERGLAYDIYREDVNTDGSAILFLSRDGILHGYDHVIEPIVTERMTDLPEYAASADRLDISLRELKNHVRCVAIGNDASRYLYTVVDEAWCSARDGEILWGLRMPTQEGWTRVSVRSDRVGTCDEINWALALMQLGLPVTPDEITHRYRRLALEWHPDRKPGDPEADRRMQELNAAMELLMGADVSAFSPHEIEQVTYHQVLSQEVVALGDGMEIEVSFSLVRSEKSAADWIYAANFGGQDHRAYLASYGGKVVEVSEAGEPVCVYDIGAVPRHVSDAGEFTYILTDTRLYVLRGERLYALIDIVDKGGLTIGEEGFALQESRTWTWYGPEGARKGQVRTRDPIRRVRWSPDGLIVETRRHRAVVTGAPPWWRGG